jgi:hypothetical protein
MAVIGARPEPGAPQLSAGEVDCLRRTADLLQTPAVDWIWSVSEGNVVATLWLYWEVEEPLGGGPVEES